MNQGKLKKAQTLGMDFLKMLAFQPDWDASPWLADVPHAVRAVGEGTELRRGPRQQVLSWFQDVRKFTNAELGLDWLMRLVAQDDQTPAHPRLRFGID